MSNMKKPKTSIINLEKLKSLYEAGVSIRQISILYNVPYASLYRVLKEKKKFKK